ncbi:MAG: ABC transporter ATP-binding protein [Thiolinea sp.]
MTAVRIEVAEMRYGNGVRTLQDLQFGVAEGEFLALVGPSGTGKTTLLNIVAGLETATAGDVRFAHGDDWTVTRPDMGFMFQEPRLMPWLTVAQNLELVRPEQGSETFAGRMDALLQQVGLADFREAYPGQLSGGMQRRAALVRAFIRRPRLLLMDEPFQSLDAPTADQLRQILLELWASTQATVLFVTHSLTEALTLADRIVFLSERPARLILDYPVQLARPRPLAQVHGLQDELLGRHPALLSGSCCEGRNKIARAPSRSRHPR